MTRADAIGVLVYAAPAAPVAAAALAFLARTPAGLDRLARGAGLVAGGVAVALATLLLSLGESSVAGSVWEADAVGGLFLAVIGVVGCMSVVASPAHLRQSAGGPAGAMRSRRVYWVGLFVFWATLMAVPLVDNLGLAWIMIEATTAASAVLVAHSGRSRALEAGWKYLVLTSVGLTVTLFGIVALYASTSQGDASLAVLDWGTLGRATSAADREAVLAGFVLVIAGLAAKIGWAPVHNWLPDAHSEAPPPVSALLSAALLPAVALVGWRVAVALTPTIGTTVIAAVFIGFGLASLAVAVPFLWRPLPWKRLLAYSSLEHMGVIALGIGFQHRLATAGVLLHVAGHAAAKATGFCAAVPLVRYQPAAGRRPPRGLVATSPSLATAVGLSLGVLAGLPPSPLLVSEILILLGGFSAGYGWAAASATALLALGFVGLAHVMIESLAGRRSGRRPASPRSLRTTTLITAVSAVALAGLLVVSFVVPNASIVRVLT